MKKLLFLILISSIVFISCDGRDRTYKTNVEVLKESNLFDSFSTQTKYIPNNHIEIYTDTILNTGFQVKLKYSSLENNYVSKTIKSKKDTLININYKNFEAEFQVIKNNILITEKIINKALFSNFEDQEFWNKAIMQYVWLDHNTSTKNHINLNTSFCVPETEICKDFTITINEDGYIKIKEINLIANTL